MANLVSVIIPTHNRTEYLSEVIESVLSQTVSALEIVVVDDGSEERHVDKLLEISQMHEIIHLFRLEENKGVSHARNFGVKQAKGDIIVFLDDDDLLHEAMIENGLNTFESNPDINVVLAGGELLYQDLTIPDQLEKYASMNSQRRIHLLENQNYSAMYFILFGMFLTNSLMFRKKVLVEFPFDEELRIGEDTFQWMYLKKNGVIFKKISTAGGIYRNHTGQVSNSQGVDLKKKTYLKKSLNLLSGFEREVFVLMNYSLLCATGLIQRKNWIQLLMGAPKAFVYHKWFMLGNRAERMLYNFRVVKI